MMTTVLVAFQVSADTADAEDIVRQRLDEHRLLLENDGTDVVRGSVDPINCYAVIPLAAILSDAA